MKSISFYYKKILFVFILLTFLPLTSIKSNHDVIAEIQPQEFEYGSISKQPTLDIIDSTLVEDFFDDLIPTQLEYWNVVGATASFVKDGELVFSKGYGYSNKLLATNVEGNETLFRIGSISKTFTAVAVLQLVEDGVLGLDVDVNNYITEFKIPETFENPITIRHLLTHTAGFEETAYSVIYLSPFSLTDLETLLATGMPDRVRPPGEICAYSNYGLALAGYIVEIMSGRDFEEYIEDEICIPIGMNSTTFRQPLPSGLSTDMSNGYDSNKNSGDFEYVSVYPAGSCSSTALDMSKFMLALLNNGIYNGTRILENDTVDIMLGDNFVSHEELQGVGLGVYEMDKNGYNVIGHGGDTYYFHSRMFLIPEQGLGVFISYNSRPGVYAKSELFSVFMDDFFPFESIEIDPLNNHKRRASKFAGFYVTTRRAYSNKPLIDEREWMGEGFEIIAKRGHLIIKGIEGIKFVEVEPLFFRETTGVYDFAIAFHEDDKGRITHFTSNIFGALYALEKTFVLYFNSEIQAGILFGVYVLMFLSLVYWGIRGIVRSLTKKDRDPKMLRMARWSALINFSLFGIIMLFTLLRIYSDILLEVEINQVFRGLLIFPYLFIMSTISLIVFSGFAWTGVKDEVRKPYWNLDGRVHYSIYTLLSVGLIGILAYWNLLGF